MTTDSEPIKEFRFTAHRVARQVNLIIIENCGDGRFKFGIGDTVTHGDVADAVDALHGLLLHLVPGGDGA